QVVHRLSVYDRQIADQVIVPALADLSLFLDQIQRLCLTKASGNDQFTQKNLAYILCFSYRGRNPLHQGFPALVGELKDNPRRRALFFWVVSLFYVPALLKAFKFGIEQSLLDIPYFRNTRQLIDALMKLIAMHVYLIQQRQDNVFHRKRRCWA